MTNHTTKGPLRHRLLVYVFAIAFGVLFYWLLGFIMHDIGTRPGPNYADLEEQLLDQQLTDKSKSLEEQIADIEREISQRTNRQKLIKDSMDNSQQTMDQLLEIQRLSLEKESELSPEEQAAMAENIQLFLSNQRQYQTLNEEISRLSEQLSGLQQQQRDHNDVLVEKRVPIREEFETQIKRHNMRMAALKLAVLIPLLLIVVVLCVRQRDSIYASLFYAMGVALAVKVAVVMHEHFPTVYFKYVLIIASLLIVACVLVYLLRMVAFPKRDWLLKQYREAYESFLCPVCRYPIRRGPLKYMSWTPRSIRRAAVPMPASESEGQDEPYSCPSCGTQLFGECDGCHAIRHCLLPACEKCGATTPVSSG